MAALSLNDECDLKHVEKLLAACLATEPQNERLNNALLSLHQVVSQQASLTGDWKATVATLRTFATSALTTLSKPLRVPESLRRLASTAERRHADLDSRGFHSAFVPHVYHSLTMRKLSDCVSANLHPVLTSLSALFHVLEVFFRAPAASADPNTALASVPAENSSPVASAKVQDASADRYIALLASQRSFLSRIQQISVPSTRAEKLHRFVTTLTAPLVLDPECIVGQSSDHPFFDTRIVAKNQAAHIEHASLKVMDGFRLIWRADVVLKVFEISHSARQHHFGQEALRMRTLAHPCIPLFHGHHANFQHAGKRRVTVATERMSYDLRSAKNLLVLNSFEVRVRVLCDVASALAFLHRNRVYHAALKPENVLLRIHARGLQGPAKLDVTCFLRRALQLPLSRRRVYEPPEVYSNGFDAFYTGDIWSFGVLATFLLTDASSEEDDTEFFKLSLAKGPVFPARSWARRIRHSGIRNLVGKCLAALPADRITARELVDELQDILRFNNSIPQEVGKDEQEVAVQGDRPLVRALDPTKRLDFESFPEGNRLHSTNGSPSKKTSPSPRKFRGLKDGSVPSSGVKIELHSPKAVCPAKRRMRTENQTGTQFSKVMRQKWTRERLSEMEIDTDLTAQDDDDDFIVPLRSVKPPSRPSTKILQIDLTGSDVNDVTPETENDSSPVKVRRKRRRLLSPGSSKDRRSPRATNRILLTISPTRSAVKLHSQSKSPKNSPKEISMCSPADCQQNMFFSTPSAAPFCSADKEFVESRVAPATHETEKLDLSLQPINQDRQRREACPFPLCMGDSKSQLAEGVASVSQRGEWLRTQFTSNTHKKQAPSSCVGGPGDRIIMAASSIPITAINRERTEAGDGTKNHCRSLHSFPRRESGTTKSEPLLEESALGAGKQKWESRKERPSTRKSVNHITTSNGVTVKSEPGLPSNLQTYKPATTAQVCSTKDNQDDKKFRSSKIGRKRRKSRSRSVEIIEPKKEGKSGIKDEKATSSKTPWAGRMRRRTLKRYSEELAPISDSDSIDFWDVSEEPSTFSQPSSRNEKQENKMFKRLVSVNDQVLMNALCPTNDRKLESIQVGPLRSSPVMLDSDVQGIYALGYLRGSKDNLDPFEYFRRESGKGDTMAQVRLGILYENGVQCQRDYGEAFYYFKLASSKGNNEGRLRLARCYEEGRGVTKNESAAFALYLLAASANFPVAHYKTAKCFLEGRGVVRDVNKAVSHLEEAVNGDILEAAYCLAQLYDEGKDVPRNYGKAFYLYGSAAHSGLVQAKVKLAHCFAKGKGCKRSIAKAVELYKKAATANDPEALFSIGLLYEDGQGVKASVQKALDSYIASAAQGYPPGVTALGQCYRWGYGVVQDMHKAKQLFEAAAEKSHALAMLELGNCYKEGDGVEKSIEKSLHYYRNAADRGDAVAMVELGECYYYGRGFEVDYDRAFSWFQKGADNGAAEGYRWVGDCYVDSLGTERDYKKAVQMYRKASELGSAAAQLGLGKMYEQGSGVDKSKHKALQCYRKAAERGNFTAMNNLGILYEKGELVKQDYAKAVSFYRKAKELGCVDAICNLGDCYATGNGVEKNVVTAFKLYKEAAENGLPSAVCEVGICYYRGRGVAADHRRALELLEGIKSEEPEALRQLGIIHYDGIAVPQDRKRACELFKESIRNGNKNACLSLAICLLNGEGVPKDEKAAVESLKEAAMHGNLSAYMFLGNCYYEGIGIDKDLKMALECFKKGYHADPMLS
eukprot:TRINITY_DN3506_c0_g1_i1.p1 TRINITY_DN3506_c0_g1~~TRINITY_DN3506_c0_g1_i1.p1  ORF type:complete len:1741 (-),score=221.99 TRINITY_DN3506_c0_g1_i1:863-6085(-)